MSHQVNFFIKTLRKTQILTSIKGCNTGANLQKKNTIIYITNVDLVNDDVYTRFGLILSIRSQDIEQKPNSDMNQGRNPVANLLKQLFYHTNKDLVNDDVFTKFGLILSFRSQYIE